MTSAPASISARLGRFASLNLAQQVWLAALSLVGTPILYHGLGETAYGILAVVNMLAAQLAVLEFGFGHATIRWLARARAGGREDRVARILATSLWVFTAMALVGATALVLARGWLAEEFFRIPAELLPTARGALAVGGIFFAASMLANLAAAAWQGFQRFVALNLIGAAGSTLQVAGSVALVLAGFSVLHVLIWSAVLAGALLGVHAWGLREEVSAGDLLTGPDPRVFREMAGFGLILMLAGVFSQIYLTTGSLVLGHFVLVGVLPFFTVPFGIFQRLYRLAGGISSALYPLVSELDGREDRATLGRVFLSGTRILLLAGLGLGLPGLLLAGPFLEVWMGAEFARSATPVLERLFLAFVLVLATVPSVELARGSGHPGRVATYVGILAAVNLIGVALLAPVDGVVGAATAFLLAQAVGSGVIMAWTGRGALAGLLEPRLALTVVGATVLAWLLHGLASDPWARAMAALAVAGTVGLLGYGTLEAGERDVLRRSVRGARGRE